MNYKVRFVDFPLHYHNMEGEIDAVIKEVLNGGDYIMRQHLRDFESNLASFVGVKYAVGLNSGTDAIQLSLLAAGVVPGDEVITVAHTFVATVSTIVHCGAKPVLLDVDNDFNMDLSQIESAITPKTKAIIPVYLNGRLCDMEKLMAIARKHNLPVIEDAAQALGANFDGQKAGSFGFSGCFSFYPAKILGSLGDGGALVTNSSDVADKAFLLRDHSVQRSTGEIMGYGFNSRLDNLQAAVLDVKLRHLPDWIERRRELASLYEKGLSGLLQVQTPPPPQPGRYFDVFTNYVIRTRERDRLLAHLTESGIEILVSWPVPMHHHRALGLSHFSLPETERVSKEVLSLPLNTEVTDEQIEYVIESIRNFYNS
ncbi:DegT/DnrJ/EryC1/StrS family aminotransferase [Chloroflexota bacterium]